MFDTPTLQQYRSFKDNVAAATINSGLIKLIGSDRKSFLHNFCTNEIKAMPENSVCEAFILDEKGKIRFHVHVINGTETLWLHSVANEASAIIEHLDKYLLRDDVQMAAAANFEGLFIAGPKSAETLSGLLANPLPKNGMAEISPDFLVAHVDLAGMGYLCLTTNDAKQQIPDIAVAGSDALHSIRIENATPWMGIDIDSSNLPQEILRDDQCISFTKGCYLGQETVARIDAIGRVNRVIVKIQSIKPIQVDDQLHYDEKPVGKVLSVSWSPDQNCFLALAMVRRPHEKSSTQLTCGDDTVSVV